MDEFPQNEFATSSISASGLTGDPGQVSVGSLISKLSWHQCNIPSNQKHCIVFFPFFFIVMKQHLLSFRMVHEAYQLITKMKNKTGGKQVEKEVEDEEESG